MEIKNNKFWICNEDYLKFIKKLESESIDFICIDPPFGKINGMQLSGQKRKIDWDSSINWKRMFKEFSRILKKGGTIAVFGQNPTYSEMILSNKKDYKYDLVWIKNNAAQGFHHNKMPLVFTENIAIFINEESKKNKRTFNNISTRKEVNKEHHYCRWYSQQLLKFINLPRRKIHEILGHRKLEFFFYYTGRHFGLLSEDLYKELIDNFKIKSWEHYVSFKKLKRKWNLEKQATKNIKLDGSKYSKTLKNYFFVNKENKYFHPTQKPVELMEKLVLIFSNEGNKVLDCFMGSGSTGLACLKNNRFFIGVDLDKKYFKVAKERLLKG